MPIKRKEQREAFEVYELFVRRIACLYHQEKKIQRGLVGQACKSIYRMMRHVSESSLGYTAIRSWGKECIRFS